MHNNWHFEFAIIFVLGDGLSLILTLTTTVVFSVPIHQSHRANVCCMVMLAVKRNEMKIVNGLVYFFLLQPKTSKVSSIAVGELTVLSGHSYRDSVFLKTFLKRYCYKYPPL